MKERIRKRKAKQYAADFLNEVKQRFPRFEGCAVPAVKCYRRFVDMELENGKHAIAAGFTPTAEGGSVIEVYGIAKQRPEELKRTIRHEMLHAILMQKDFPYEDDSDIFLMMAAYYEAMPYKLFFDEWDTEAEQRAKIACMAEDE